MFVPKDKLWKKIGPWSENITLSSFLRSRVKIRLANIHVEGPKKFEHEPSTPLAAVVNKNFQFLCLYQKE